MRMPSRADPTAALPISAPAGAVLFKPGDPCRGYVDVISGTIMVSMTTISGRDIQLYRVGPGDVCLQTFSALTEDIPYAATGVAEDVVAAELIPPAAFDRRMAGDAAFRARIMGAVARRFGEFETLVERLTSVPVEARLAGVLLAEADADGQVRRIHQQLANGIGASRESVSRALAAWSRQGVIASGRGVVHILRADVLERLTRV